MQEHIESLRAVRTGLTEAESAVVSFGAGGIGEMSFYQLSVTTDIIEHFFLVADRVADGRLAGTDTVASRFSPGYRSEPHEIPWIDLGEDRFEDLAVDVRSAGATARHQMLTDEILADDPDCQLYSICFQREGGSNVIAWRRLESRHRLRQSVGSRSFWSLRFDDIESDVFVFDGKVDALIYGERLFLIREYTCRTMLALASQMVGDVERAVGAITNDVPISNSEEFVEACARQPAMLAKLSSIIERDYIDEINIADVEAVAEANGVDVDFTTRDGRRMLVFEQGPSKRWAILKLLDDDYLISQMTERSYEAPSKRRV